MSNVRLRTWRRREAWRALALTLVAGCGGGGDGAAPGNSGFGGAGADALALDSQAHSLRAHAETLTPDEAYHLLRRAAFGATPQQVEQAVRLGLSATINDLLTVRPDPPELTALVDAYEIDRIDMKWLVHLIDGPNPLRERLSMFWHDRLAASRRVLDGRDRGLADVHWRMLREHAMGNYRVLLQELTIDPLMLLWLNGADSPKDRPNENYAREFWELFTLGRDVLYTEEDIREGARAFTGITLLREQEENARPIFDLLNHDDTFKAIFPGRTGPVDHDYLSVIDLTLEQPEAADYVARNLFEMFVHPYPSDAVVRELGGFFAESGFEIAPLVRRILHSEAMFSESARQAHISSPVEHIVGVARTLDMHAYSEESQGEVMDRLARDLRGAGHELLNPPGVQGWEEDEGWLDDRSIMARLEALGRTMEYGPQRTPDLPYHLLPAAEKWDQREIRDHILETLIAVFHLQLTTQERDIYREVLDQDGWRALHLEEPEYRPYHVFELIRLMAMHPQVIGT